MVVIVGDSYFVPCYSQNKILIFAFKMSHLIEYRKVNDTYVPLYFKFATIATKYNLTSDKYMSVENWMYIFDQLDEILASEASSAKKSKIFDTDNGRLTVKAKWIRLSDLTGVGNHILKILNLSSSSTNVGKHYLKIEINSNFQRLLTDLQQQNKLLEEKSKISEPNNDEHDSVQHENCDGLNSSEILMKKENHTSDYGGYEDLNEERLPTYQPEKNSAQIEKNQIQSEYSPTFINANKSAEENVSYRPSRRSNRSSEYDDAKKLSAKKSRLRGRSKELFGTSDEEELQDIVDKVSSSSQHKSKRKKDTPSRKERNRESFKSKKKKISDSQYSQDSVAEVSDISVRNLMDESINSILDTFSDHEEHLTELYETHIKQLKRSYRPKDIPELAAHDLVNPKQFKAMVDFLEKKLVRNLEMEHNYTYVIFDAILPEWAFGIFCKKFQYTRSEALETLHLQSVALSNRSDSQLL